MNKFSYKYNLGPEEFCEQIHPSQHKGKPSIFPHRWEIGRPGSIRFNNRNQHTIRLGNGNSTTKKSQNCVFIARCNICQGECTTNIPGETKPAGNLQPLNTHFPFRNFAAIKCFPNISGLETKTLDITNIHMQL